MNIALVLQHKLLLGIQRFMHGNPAPVRASVARPVHRPAPRQVQRITQGPVGFAIPGNSNTATLQVAAKVMPLRVLRVVETGSPRSSTGRMVISGRMADVCAELDRLVEREAALQTLH